MTAGYAIETHAATVRASRTPQQQADWAWENELLDVLGRATGRAVGPVDIVALPQVVNITIYRGMDFTLLLDVTGPDGQPADVTSRTVMAQIRATPEAEEVGGDWHCVPDGSTIVLSLDSATTAQLPADGRWDVWLCDHPRTPLAAGLFTVAPRVTRCPP